MAAAADQCNVPGWDTKETGQPLIQGLLLVPDELVSKDNIDAVIARQQSPE